MEVRVAEAGESSVEVIKSDGSVEKFLMEKIERSLENTLVELSVVTGQPIPVDIHPVVEKICREVVEKARRNGGRIFSKEISDIIERTLIELSIEKPLYEEVAKAYALKRIYKEAGFYNKLLDKKDLKLTFNSIKLLEKRYLLKNPETLKLIETPQMLFRRVAKHLASIEKLYGASDEEVAKVEEEFYRILSDLKFIPNSPTLMNAGTRVGVLSACFVLPIRDAMTTPDGEGIMDSLRAMALIQKSGGGTGWDFSELRPEGDVVASTAGVASGPLSFMRMFDVATDVIKQGGRRRGANMGVLHVWHADIEKFIKAKSGKLKDIVLQNFNISVGIYDEFFKAVEEGRNWPLINPRKTLLDKDLGHDSRFYGIVRARHSIREEWVQEEILNELEERDGAILLSETKILTFDEALAIAENEGAIVREIEAKKLFNEIAYSAWDSGDPGLLFIDTINRRHPVWYLGKINATNPCGEVPALTWESCNLGSINLEKFVKEENGKPTIDWEDLGRTVRIAVRFLDNVIDANKYPLKQIEEATKKTRKIGLGVMGWAHMLIKLKIPYDSPDALYLAYYLMEWIEYNAILESIMLAGRRGSFPAYDPEKYRPTWLTAKPLREIFEISGIKEEISEHVRKIVSERPLVDWKTIEALRKKIGLRNAAVTSIAPTGSISIIAGTTSSIEPLFAIAFVRHVTVGTFIEVDRLFQREIMEYGIVDKNVFKEIAKTGSIVHMENIPYDLKKIYRTAHDIEPTWHILHQAVFQQWVDQGVSKTINMRSEVPPEAVYEAYMLAWKLGCKGITVYRDKSKSQQVIYFGVKSTEESKNEGNGKSKKKSKLTLKSLKLTSTKVRIKNEEYVSALEEYAGGCLTCDI